MLGMQKLGPQDNPSPDGSADNPPVELLVIDDSPAICRLLLTALSQEGFRVWVATEGKGALHHLRNRPGLIRLALVDVCLPEQDGAAIVRAMLQLEPNLPFVFMTGYAGNFTIRELQLLGPRAFLFKPFSVHEVLVLVQTLLESSPWQDGPNRSSPSSPL